MLMRKQSVCKYSLWGNGLGALRVLLVLVLLPVQVSHCSLRDERRSLLTAAPAPQRRGSACSRCVAGFCLSDPLLSSSGSVPGPRTHVLRSLGRREREEQQDVGCPPPATSLVVGLAAEGPPAGSVPGMGTTCAPAGLPQD